MLRTINKSNKQDQSEGQMSFRRFSPVIYRINYYGFSPPETKICFSIFQKQRDVFWDLLIVLGVEKQQQKRNKQQSNPYKKLKNDQRFKTLKQTRINFWFYSCISCIVLIILRSLVKLTLNGRWVTFVKWKKYIIFIKAFYLFILFFFGVFF